MNNSGSMFARRMAAALMLLTGLLLAALTWAAPARAASATLSIPSIGVEAPLVDVYLRQFPDGSITWDVAALTHEVGLLDGMARFGEGDNIGLGGHSLLGDGTPGVFYTLDQVRVGDEVLVTVDGHPRRYVVTRTLIVSEHDVRVFYPTDGERLTIITCDTRSYSGGRYLQRFVVVAEPAG